MQSASELYARGYTISAAARAIGCSAAHLWCALNGTRSLARLSEKLAALPPRPLVLREKLPAGQKRGRSAGR